MRATPGTHIRLALSDFPAKLEPEGAATGLLRLDYGGERELVVSDGSATVGRIDAPALASVEWRDAEGAALYSTELEVVARHYFPLSALKATGEGDDFVTNSEEELRDARQAATETFALNARRSFVRRIGSTETYRGGFVWLEHSDVRELMTDGWALMSDCTARGPEGHAVIRYRYGLDEIPARVSDAVLALARYYLRPSVTPDRATGEATEAGFIRYTLAGKDGATGLPEVDAAIEQFGRQRVVVL